MLTAHFMRFLRRERIEEGSHHGCAARARGILSPEFWFQDAFLRHDQWPVSAEAVADFGARRPGGKARRPSIPGVCEGGATPPAGMPRPKAASDSADTGHKATPWITLAIAGQSPGRPR